MDLLTYLLIAKLWTVYATACHASLCTTNAVGLTECVSCHCHRTALTSITSHNRASHKCGLNCSVRKPTVDVHRPLRKLPVDAHAHWESLHSTRTGHCTQLRGVQRLHLASPAHFPV